MIRLSVINQKGERFDKEFNNLKAAKRFILRARYGRKVFVESISADSEEIKVELAKIW